jgi:hypothetical protein
MKVTQILVTAFFITVSSPTLSHDLRPIFIDAFQNSAQSLILRWKVPSTVPRGQVPMVLLSDGCQPETEPQISLRGDSYQAEQAYQCLAGVTGKILSLAFPGSNPSLTTVIRIKTHDGQLISGLLAPGELNWEIPEEPKRWEVAANYTKLGLDHIWLGWDHLMFIALLVLIARTGKRTLITVTGFTLAHSLTLALSTLDILSIPIPAVEAIIALSIVFIATEIARANKTTLTYRYPVLVSSSFGLLHGFGFASVLREVGLPTTELLTALLFFNLGVEIGQVVFVLIIFGTAILIHATHKKMNNQRAFSLSRARAGIMTAYSLGSIATFWTIERVLVFWT